VHVKHKGYRSDDVQKFAYRIRVVIIYLVAATFYTLVYSVKCQGRTACGCVTLVA